MKTSMKPLKVIEFLIVVGNSNYEVDLRRTSLDSKVKVVSPVIQNGKMLKDYHFNTPGIITSTLVEFPGKKTIMNTFNQLISCLMYLIQTFVGLRVSGM